MFKYPKSHIKIKAVHFLFVVVIFLVACNKTTVEFPFERNLTVEAFIEEGKQAKVYLTYNFPIDQVVDSIALLKSIETKAKVSISVDGMEEILILRRENSRYPMLYYETDKIIGSEDKIFNLNIRAEGKDYYSKTYIPEPFLIEQFEFIPHVSNLENHRDLYITVENPEPEKINYFNILINNPKESKNYQFTNRGLFTNETASDSGLSIFVAYPDSFIDDHYMVGDTLLIKLQSITKLEYDFWKSINGDNTQLIKLKGIDEEIPSNVEHAFGFFGGRNVSSYRIVVD